ncbi:MAG TPA: 5-oxoprolinase subunit PxpB [Mucilaginibacter sp.]|jgi:inhibitor of KinA|nr:5-oxoprolinase subunit PxpB [Mucilaginibacter sp.]
MIDLTRKSDLQVYPLSECAVTIEFGKVIDDTIVNRVNAFDRLLNKKRLPGMYQTVPAYASLTVFFDPLALLATELPGKTSFDKAKAFLLELNDEVNNPKQAAETNIISVPVCYGGAFGADLEYVTAHCNLPAEEVIRLHSEVVYKVCMIGFIPGFAYLTGLNPRLEIPRKPAPVKVAPGAVGIAGSQTGIYPLETPGGWQIIGRTPLCMFDAGRSRPSLLKAGDVVKFEPVGFADFEKYSGK